MKQSNMLYYLRLFYFLCLLHSSSFHFFLYSNGEKILLERDPWNTAKLWQLKDGCLLKIRIKWDLSQVHLHAASFKRGYQDKNWLRSTGGFWSFFAFWALYMNSCCCGNVKFQNIFKAFLVGNVSVGSRLCKMFGKDKKSEPVSKKCAFV